MENIEEIWKDVVGYEGKYIISNTNKIISLDFKRTGVRKQMIPRIGTTGYYMIVLCKDGKPKNHRMHRLIAKAFIPNPENKGDVNHIDGNKLNNDISNLEWNTRKENINHAYRIGLSKASELSRKIIRERMSKAVINIITGEEFSSITEAEIENGLKKYTLRYKLGKTCPNKEGLIFKFKDDAV